MSTMVIETGDGRRLTGSDNTLFSANLLGFLCDASTNGTLTLADQGGNRTLLSAMALTAGNYYPLNVRCSGQVVITLGGTAAGLLTYSQ